MKLLKTLHSYTKFTTNLNQSNTKINRKYNIHQGFTWFTDKRLLHGDGPAKNSVIHISTKYQSWRLQNHQNYTHKFTKKKAQIQTLAVKTLDTKSSKSGQM